MTIPLDAARVLVVGLGVTGAAVAEALTRRGVEVVVADDHPSGAARQRAESIDVELLEAPAPGDYATLVGGCDALAPAPGLPDHHPVFAAAARAGVPVISEFDVAAAYDDRPVVAITGTNGKTTVTMLVTDMLAASGRRAVAAGNTEVPLVAAIDDPDAEVFVVEASSFRLGHTRRFEPAVATWLNFAADHLDVHASLAAYEAAKARIWRDLAPDRGSAVANADDPVVMAHVRPDLPTATFGIEPGDGADWVRRDGALRGPGDAVLATVDELPRALPHDVANALAAAASAVAGGATVAGARSALLSFRTLPHRVAPVAEHGGVRWVDDSKATAPHATLAAVRGFDSVVLLAGGRNKGLDLSPLAEVADHLRAVVAIGDAAAEVEAAFAGRVPVDVATSMAEAVERAGERARPGDVVLLSPGCASFDWYGSYAERGDDFAALVRARLGREAG